MPIVFQWEVSIIAVFVAGFMNFAGFRALQQIQRHLTEATRRNPMIRKLKTGQYRLYSRKINPKTGKRRNLGTFDTRDQAVQHEREVQFFKRRA
jgi:hypothetical protein